MTRDRGAMGGLALLVIVFSVALFIVALIAFVVLVF